MSSPSPARPQSDGSPNTPGKGTATKGTASKGTGRRVGPRLALWLVILLTVALMVWVSIFTAQRNPYLSDVSRNTISRSRFIEECKAKLDAVFAEASKSQKALFTAEYEPRLLVAGARSNPQGPGWVLISQATVSRDGLGSQPIPFACQSDQAGVVKAQVAGGNNGAAPAPK